MWQENKKSVGCDKKRENGEKFSSVVSQGESGVKGQAGSGSGRIRRRDLRYSSSRYFFLRCSRCSPCVFLS
jgi:hypothetical protein